MVNHLPHPKYILIKKRDTSREREGDITKTFSNSKARQT
jgi:hypothetical protein